MKTKLLVWAECHSDDHLYEAEFDAAPWLKKATTQEFVVNCGNAPMEYDTIKRNKKQSGQTEHIKKAREAA